MTIMIDIPESRVFKFFYLNIFILTSIDSVQDNNKLGNIKVIETLERRKRKQRWE